LHGEFILERNIGVDWYFDFISPFAYLQFETLDRHPLGAPIKPIPVVLAGILNRRGQLGPAEIPGKRLFTYRFVQWEAKRRGIALKFPPAHPFNPIKALRLAIACGNEMAAIRTIFRHLWQAGRSLEEPADWQALLEQLGGADLEQKIADPAIKAELKGNGESAIAAGIFGVPTLTIGDELFWGLDATQMAADCLRNPGLLSTGEFARLTGLPIGVSRV
jgi:2-hydroxychromene-2-carboxylate isomerase